jgi:DNA-binding transcriptional LysR family regulator
LNATVNLIAAHMAACEQLMLRGEAQFLICHHHPAAATFMMSAQFRSVPLGADVLLPVSAPDATGTAPRYSLSGGSGTALPLLSFGAESGIGRILMATRAIERDEARLVPAFTSHLASILVAMARDGRGIAWAPMSLVCDDLARGTLVRAAGLERDVPIEIRLFRSRVRQSPPAERLWAGLAVRGRS